MLEMLMIKSRSTCINAGVRKNLLTIGDVSIGGATILYKELTSQPFKYLSIPNEQIVFFST